MIKAGKKTLEWESVRATLKQYHEKWEVIYCESRIPHQCTRNFALGFAHPRKRNDLKPGEIWIAILICNNAHDIIEYKWPKEAMFNYIWAVIKRRGVYFDGEKEVYL